MLLAWVLWSDWRSFLILAVTVSVYPGVHGPVWASRPSTTPNASGNASPVWRPPSSTCSQGLPTLRAFNRAPDGRRTLERAAEDFRVTTMSTLRLAFLSSLALEVLAAVGTALVALFFGIEVARRLAAPRGRPCGPGAGA